MKVEEVTHHCPECGEELKQVIWGNMFDWDVADCPHCGFSGELDTMTGFDPDGDVWQIKKEEVES